jgi:hypothetical protein
MILVWTLLNIDNNRNEPTDSRAPLRSVISVLRALSCLLGFVVGSLIMKMYSWLIEQICNFAGDSMSVLVVCVLVWTVADTLAGPIMTPSIRLQEKFHWRAFPFADTIHYCSEYILKMVWTSKHDKRTGAPRVLTSFLRSKHRVRSCRCKVHFTCCC